MVLDPGEPRFEVGGFDVEGAVELDLDNTKTFFDVVEPVVNFVEALVHVVLLLLKGSVDDCCQLLGLLVGVGLQLLGLFGKLFVKLLVGCQLLELLVEVLFGELGHEKGLKIVSVG